MDLNYEDLGGFAPLPLIKMLWRTLHVSGLEIHLKYKETKLLRTKGSMSFEIVMNLCKDEDILMSVSRVRGFLQVIFLSDIVTVDGKYIEDRATQIKVYERRSRYNFPKDFPSTNDWDI